MCAINQEIAGLDDGRRSRLNHAKGLIDATAATCAVAHTVTDRTVEALLPRNGEMDAALGDVRHQLEAIQQELRK